MGVTTTFGWRCLRSTLGFVALVALAGSGGCNSATPITPGGMPQFTELRYDGANSTAPNLPAATYEAAARFTAAQTATLVGGELIEVEFYIFFVPTTVMVKVYDAGTATTPGTLLYSADASADVTQTAWATHALTTPLTLTGGDLWIAIEFSHPLSQRVIGCDPGPAVADGDWLYASTDGMWTPFNQRFAVSVNWNIRGIVETTN